MSDERRATSDERQATSVEQAIDNEPNRFAPRGRGALLGRGGMVIAGGASGGSVVASGARNTYAMPFGQATGAALAAQQQAHEQYYDDMVFYGEQWVAEQ
eukprot:797437-Rhodomonas_salina.1